MVKIQAFDQRRDIVIPGNAEETVHFAVLQILQIAKESIEARGVFNGALSGGQTPQAIFKGLSQPEHQHALDWKKVRLFWGDERSVPPNDPESNYGTAMRSGLDKLPLASENIFRMVAEKDIEENARAYENLIKEKVPSLAFDFIMLGMGDDGHTASLFPYTQGLHAKNRLVIANEVPQKKTWRMTFTFDLINQARHICIYILGSKKANRVAQVLDDPYDPDQFPIQRVGTPSQKALWVLDQEAVV